VGHDSSVSIATRYRLNGPGIECRLGRNFPHPSRPVLGPTLPHIQWAPGIFPKRVKRLGHVVNHPHPLVLRLNKKSRTILLFPFCAFVAYSTANFIFCLYVLTLIPRPYNDTHYKADPHFIQSPLQMSTEMYQAYLSFVKIGALKYFFTSGTNVFLCVFHTFISRSGSNPVQNLHVILLNICEWLGNRCRDAVYSYLYDTTIRHFDSKERLDKSVYHVTQCTICSPVVNCIRHKSTQNTETSPPNSFTSEKQQPVI
jgi:hypothetical protein